MSRSLWVVIAILILISACTPAPQITPIPIIDNATSTPSPLPTADPTRTALPSATPTASITPLPTIPTFTPTFDVSTIATVTPAPKAECPEEISQKAFDLDNINDQGNDYNQNFITYILDYLNTGGSTNNIILKYPNPEFIRYEDLTNDEVKELVFAYGIWVDIFSCIDGKYVLSTTSTTDSAQASKIIEIVDINMDGTKEVVAYFDGCMGSRCPSINVLSWDGMQFKSLIENRFSMTEGCSYMNIAPFQVEIKDIDTNGTREIILQNVNDPWPDDIGFPYRKETRICMWNGEKIALHKIYFDEPYYRFQALEDGELATRFGDYQRALVFYQQTIHNKNLEWLTPEKRIYDFWIYHSNYFVSFQEPMPTVSPSLQPDPREYPSLAAYAYFRIKLIHLVQGNASDATTAYNTLQQTFSNDPYARPYVEMATTFWKAYQSAHKMYDGCAAAIQYAVEHPDILIPLGSDYHGSQAKIYKPEDVCPFR